MTTSELWDYFWDKKVAISKPLDRYLIWVPTEDFLAIKNQFNAEYNLYHPNKSYRSLGIFRHIHAVDEGEFFCIHKDNGNWTRFAPMIIVHFFADVLLYMIICPLKGIKIADLTKPVINNFIKTK
jgi:hypothetical protein